MTVIAISTSPHAFKIAHAGQQRVTVPAWQTWKWLSTVHYIPECYWWHRSCKHDAILITRICIFLWWPSYFPCLLLDIYLVTHILSNGEGLCYTMLPLASINTFPARKIQNDRMNDVRCAHIHHLAKKGKRTRTRRRTGSCEPSEHGFETSPQSNRTAVESVGTGLQSGACTQGLQLEEQMYVHWAGIKLMNMMRQLWIHSYESTVMNPCNENCKAVHMSKALPHSISKCC